MITEPWRIGPDDYVRAAGIDAEFDARKYHPLAAGARASWFAEYTRAKQEWRSRIIAALDAGTISIETEGLHPDGLGLIHTELTARRKRIECARRAELEANNAYVTVDELQCGEKPWCTRFTERVLVIRKHRASVDVKTSRGRIFRIVLADGVLRRMSPAEIDAAVRQRPREAASPPATTADAEARPEPPAANEWRAIVERNSGTTLDATQMRVEIVDANSRVVHVGAGIAFPMRLDFADGAARMRDEEFARMLRYERPRDIRKLIARLQKAGKLQGIHVRATVARTSMPNGGSREISVDEFWLTEREALLVATQSETAEAWTLTTLIVDVFRAVVRGELASPPSATPSFSIDHMKDVFAGAFSAAIAPVIQSMKSDMASLVKSEVESLRSEFQHAQETRALTDGSAGTRNAREITTRIRKAAHTAAGAGKGSFRRIQKEYEDRVRSAVGFPRDRAHRWELLPIANLADARIAVEQIEREVRDLVKANLADSQLPLGGA